VASWGRLIVEYDATKTIGHQYFGMPANRVTTPAGSRRGEFLMGRMFIGLVGLWSLCAGCQWSSNSSSGLTSLIRVQGGQATHAPLQARLALSRPQ